MPHTTAHHQQIRARAEAADETTRRLLGCGVAAGPVFILVWAVQAFTRDGFDPTRHPASLLALGDLGWIQVANFVITGALFVACAFGLRRVLHPGRASTWGPILIGAFGAGLILAGIFTTDPGAGFPEGAPSGAPQLSWHGALHEVGHLVALASWTAACFVFRRRFAADGDRVLSRACVVSVVVVFVIAAWPDLTSLPIRLMIATAVQFGLVALIAVRLRGTFARG